MATTTKNVILRAYVEDSLTDLMVRTNVDNVTLNDNGTETTLAAKLADIISTLNNKATKSDIDTAVSTKVDKVSGKGLSTNDFTATLLTKLNGIAAGAQVNKIETIKVNGVVQTISSKGVNVIVPTGAMASKDTVSESNLDSALQEKVNAASEGNHTHSNKTVLDSISSAKTGNWDAGYAHSKAAHAPSNAQTNVIESVKVNGVEQTVSNKVVNISMPLIYAQSNTPTALKDGDLFLQILE